jgi:single-strand DNA-binding protein
MNGLNRVTLVGALGQDPELKFTQGGQAILKFRMATTESYADKEGKRQERTEWHSVVMWGKRAESLNKLLFKGRTVWVEGRLQTRNWDDKNGEKRYATEVVATDVGLLGKGKEGGEQRSERGQQSSGDEAPSGEDFGDIPW